MPEQEGRENKQKLMMKIIPQICKKMDEKITQVGNSIKDKHKRDQSPLAYCTKTAEHQWQMGKSWRKNLKNTFHTKQEFEVTSTYQEQQRAEYGEITFQVLIENVSP